MSPPKRSREEFEDLETSGFRLTHVGEAAMVVASVQLRGAIVDLWKESNRQGRIPTGFAVGASCFSIEASPEIVKESKRSMSRTLMFEHDSNAIAELDEG